MHTDYESGTSNSVTSRFVSPSREKIEQVIKESFGELNPAARTPMVHLLLSPITGELSGPPLERKEPATTCSACGRPSDAANVAVETAGERVLTVEELSKSPMSPRRRSR